MKHLKQHVREFAKADQGQDLIEYALMAGFIAVAAGAMMPNISKNVGNIFNKIQSILTASGG